MFLEIPLSIFLRLLIPSSEFLFCLCRRLVLFQTSTTTRGKSSCSLGPKVPPHPALLFPLPSSRCPDFLWPSDLIYWVSPKDIPIDIEYAAIWSSAIKRGKLTGIYILRLMMRGHHLQNICFHHFQGGFSLQPVLSRVLIATFGSPWELDGVTRSSSHPCSSSEQCITCIARPTRQARSLTQCFLSLKKILGQRVQNNVFVPKKGTWDAGEPCNPMWKSDTSLLWQIAHSVAPLSWNA